MYLKFNDTITSFRFKENTVDRCIYLKVSGSKYVFFETKKFLSIYFEMKDMGETAYVIGIEIFRDRTHGILRLSKKAYIERILERFGMKNCSS